MLPEIGKSICLVAALTVGANLGCTAPDRPVATPKAVSTPKPATRPKPTTNPAPTTRPKLQSPINAATARLRAIADSLKPSDIDEIRQLIKLRADVNIVGEKGAPLLYAAAGDGYVEIVELLLKADACVDGAHNASYVHTPLLIASRQGHIEVVKLLLAANADVTVARRRNGGTALYLASYKGHRDIVKLLLTTKVDINAACYKSGIGPIFIASAMGNVDVVKLLITANVDVNALTNVGQTALTVAKHQKHHEIIQLLTAAGGIDPQAK
ncbi:MAG: hypothetical protein HN350_17630 [Phycisphaerales bacterium]|jgi:ankyrin repeat protein|nr:hypothetical protein [Phycisphaerales bacterium]